MEHEGSLIYNHLGADAWNSVHLHKQHKNDTFAENRGEAGGKLCVGLSEWLEKCNAVSPSPMSLQKLREGLCLEKITWGFCLKIVAEHYWSVYF